MRSALVLIVSILLASCASEGGTGSGTDPTTPDSSDGAEASDGTADADAPGPIDDAGIPDDGADPKDIQGGETEVSVTPPDVAVPGDVVDPPGDTSTTPPVDPGSVGGACGADGDCTGPGAVCLDMPGGYCTIPGCAGVADACPEGSTCFLFGDEGSYCLDTCVVSDECREDDGYVCDQDNTCWPGDEPPAPTGESPVGGACNVDADCKDPGASCYPPIVGGNPTGFLGGYCLINGCEPGGCPEGSKCEVIYADGNGACMAECDAPEGCRADEGYACYDQGICFPGCSENIPCPAAYACGDKGFCVPDCAPGECTGGLVCDEASGQCVEPPCTPGSCPNALVCSLTSGKCVPDMSGGPGAGPGPSCPSLPTKDCVEEPAYCGELMAFEPVEGPGYENYPLNGESWANQYRSYARRDMLMLVKWAAAYVECKSAGWDTGNGYPIGLGDMSEVDGAIPGTSIGQPGHPEGTHLDGYDMDIAYYQNDLTGQPNNYLRAICDHTIDGVEQYHCVSEPYMMDIWRSALFIGALFSSPRTRVIGVDGMAGSMISQALAVLCADGWLPAAACEPGNQDLACEVEAGVDGGLCWEESGSGWFYHHHHHLHLSLWGVAGNTWGAPSDEKSEGSSATDATALDRAGHIRALQAKDYPGLVRTVNPVQRPSGAMKGSGGAKFRP
jgi:hypothetical protein